MPFFSLFFVVVVVVVLFSFLFVCLLLFFFFFFSCSFIMSHLLLAWRNWSFAIYLCAFGFVFPTICK